ncbi:hypothetical protein Pla52n_03420 [Stieleria varia]|uniref:Uncharacterized protein n=1 Tax=Stieleria varia TaxID=2528005 RepID=A0A5C6B712_9BACT|nr:hypothetical protein Pla52n_03420 [Stieleria varia]
MFQIGSALEQPVDFVPAQHGGQFLRLTAGWDDDYMEKVVFSR